MFKPGITVSWNIGGDPVAPVLQGDVLRVYTNGSGAYIGKLYAFCGVQTREKPLTHERGRITADFMRHPVPLDNPALTVLGGLRRGTEVTEESLAMGLDKWMEGLEVVKVPLLFKGRGRLMTRRCMLDSWNYKGSPPSRDDLREYGRLYAVKNHCTENWREKVAGEWGGGL